MATLRQREQTFITASVLLGLVSVALLVYLLTPLSPSSLAKQEELAALQQEYRTKRNSPLAGIPEKLTVTQRELRTFYKDRIPSQDSGIVLEIGKLASKSGITLTSVSYATKAAGTSGFDRVNITTSVTGDYSKIARFIREIEHDKTFMLIDQISLAEQKTGVGLQITIETYLHSEQGSPAASATRRSRSGD